MQIVKFGFDALASNVNWAISNWVIFLISSPKGNDCSPENQHDWSHNYIYIDFFKHSREATAAISNGIWLKIELIRSIAKNEDLIKDKDTRVLTSKNRGTRNRCN